MIEQQTIDAYNSRLTVDLNKIKTMTPGQLDQVKAYGSQAEALLKNKDLALMIHHFKFEVADALSTIHGHTQDDNARRIALSNQLAGIDGFVASLQRALYMKNRVVTQQQEGPAERPTDVTKKAYSV
jgi:hypothetical protein